MIYRHMKFLLFPIPIVIGTYISAMDSERPIQKHQWLYFMSYSYVAITKLRIYVAW